MDKLNRPKQLEKNGDSPFRNEMVHVCSRRYLLIRKASWGLLMKRRAHQSELFMEGAGCK